MFTIDPKITAVPLKGKSLFKALFSMNSHNVATPEMGLSEARSYVFFFREGNKKLSAYIGIYLIHGDRKMFYSYSGNPFSENEIETVEEEAQNFTEDLGAMLDELDCTHLSDQEKDQWIEAQEILSRTPAIESQPEAPPPAAPAAAPQPETVQPPPVQQAPPAPPAPQVNNAAPAAPAAAPQPETVQPPPVQQAPQTSSAPRVNSAAPVAPGLPASTEPPFQPQVSQHSHSQNASDRLLAQAAAIRQSSIRKSAKAGITQPPRQSPKQDADSPDSVVSRDREALARLFTSF